MKFHTLLILFVLLNSCSDGIKEKLLEARKYSTANNYKEAIEVYNQILQIDSINSSALGGRGLMYYNLGDYEQALLDYNKALTSKSQAFNIYYNRGLTFYALGDYDNALKDFDTVLSNNTEDYMALYQRGYTKMAENKYVDAIHDFDKAIKIEPIHYFYENRGVCKFFIEDIEGALTDLSEAIRLNPQSTSALFNRANIYYSLNNYRDAIKDFEKVVAINPNDTNAVIWLKKSQEMLNGN